MKHLIEEIDEIESLMFEEKQRTVKIALNSIFWSFFSIEFGCEFMHEPYFISGLCTLLTGALGARTYISALDSRNIVKEYEKQLKELRK